MSEEKRVSLGVGGIECESRITASTLSPVSVSASQRQLMAMDMCYRWCDCDNILQLSFVRITDRQRQWQKRTRGQHRADDAGANEETIALYLKS